MSDCNFQFKQGSLKDILEELGKLQNADNTKKKVFSQLRDGLNTYCGNGYLEAFYGDQSGMYGSTSGVSYAGGGTIQALTDAGKKISRQILQNPTWADRHEDPHADHDKCIKKYSEALQACLPKTFAALFFLFFNVAKECASFGGGSWNTLKVKGSGQNLYKWLIESDSDLPGGFSQKDLNTSKTGKDVAEKLKSAVSLKPDTYSGSLQNVLCGFMFVCKWDDALTGHACLFLSTFCSKVNNNLEAQVKEKFKGNSETFKNICNTLVPHLNPLVYGSGFDSDLGLRAVSHGGAPFDTLWDDAKFSEYCDWLKTILEALKKSLEKMSSEASSKWSSSALQNSESAGPFKYGFVFTNGNWESQQREIQKYVSTLTGDGHGSLNSLLKCLKGEYSAISQHQSGDTTGNPGATAGGVTTGVLGAGGLGFGAAYATNAFGFQNLITSFISSFLK
ncbi:secreted antigen 1 [Babesia divergens]|uniref:Secreted antigen 1 n=1 Tax=Babesia divergens TaxID=32595 RepID=A0AAD9LFT5_BABDI|nr:secreted antigen 1 [Babesia divergens]